MMDSKYHLYMIPQYPGKCATYTLKVPETFMCAVKSATSCQVGDLARDRGNSGGM
jgi:hypothetical protein